MTISFERGIGRNISFIHPFAVTVNIKACETGERAYGVCANGYIGVEHII